MSQAAAVVNLAGQPGPGPGRAQHPEALAFLFQPSRYKVAWGGRGGTKSWGFARALLAIGYQAPKRILCARETMQSISDSVHALLKDQVVAMGLESFYDVQKSTIVGLNGTAFTFAGLKHNVQQIKSTEAVDIVWVEEAEKVSKGSWETLIPTVRKEGSEIWVSFNPELATDDTYRRFVTSPPPGAVVRKLTWRDNPWLSDVLRAEMRYLKESDPAAYDHVWEGACISTVEGAIYAAEIRAVESGGRITRVPYDPTRPVHTFWDLGYGDSTAVWFVQVHPFEYRCIDYLEGMQYPLAWYQKAIQSKPYIYGNHYLPHDAKSKQLGTGKSIEELMRSAGFAVRIVPKLSLTDGINAVRMIMPRVWFDGEKCADGLQNLRHYRWGPIGQLGQQRREPLHDWASHGADAFRYFAVGIRPVPASDPVHDRFGWQPEASSCWS